MTIALDKSSWTRFRFGDLVANINDYYVPDSDGVLPYVAGPHIAPGEATVQSYGSTDDDQFPPTFKRKFRAGDVLLHSRGIEKLASVDRDGVTGEKLFVLRSTNVGVLSQDFVQWLLLSPSARAHLRDNFTGSVNKFLNWRPLAAFEFDLPPLDDQKRIADLLWSIERTLNRLSYEAAAASQMRAAWRQSVFGGVHEMARLDECAEVSLGRQRAPQHASGEHMRSYVRSANISGGQVSLDDLKQMNFTPAEQRKFRLRTGDVLVSEGTASPRELGSSAVWDPVDEDREMYFQKTLLRLRAQEGRSTSTLLREWAAWARESGAFLRVATGTGILHITAVRCAAMPYPVMDRPEMASVERQAQTLRDAVGAVEHEHLRLRALRAAVLAEVSGDR